VDGGRTAGCKELFCAEVGFAYAHHYDGVAGVAVEVIVPEVAEEFFGLVFDAGRVCAAGLRERCIVGVFAFCGFGIRDVGGDVDVENAVAGRDGPVNIRENAVGLD
jgi:hypothetical protein